MRPPHLTLPASAPSSSSSSSSSSSAASSASDAAFDEADSVDGDPEQEEKALATCEGRAIQLAPGVRVVIAGSGAAPARASAQNVSAPVNPNAGGRALRSEPMSLSAEDQKNMSDLAAIGSQWSPATVRINQDADRLYRLHRENFPQERWASRPLYPLNSEEVAHFVRWLASVNGGERYRYNSIENASLAGICRIHMQHTGGQFAHTMPDWFQVNTAMRAIKAQHHRRQKRVDNDNAHPILLSDVDLMIRHIPPWDRHRVHDATVMLLGVVSGARAVTIEGIRVSDVINVRPEAGSSGATPTTVSFTVLLTKHKGRYSEGFGHNYTGDINAPPESRSRDLAYWLHRYLKTFFPGHPGLVPGAPNPYADSEVSLFPQSNDDLFRSRLAKRAADAGYPAGMIVFHGNRRGFVAMAILNAHIMGLNVGNVMDNLAILGGWSGSHSDAFLTYVKNATLRAFDVTAFIQGRAQVVSLASMEPETFHQLPVGTLRKPNPVFMTTDVSATLAAAPAELRDAQFSKFFREQVRIELLELHPETMVGNEAVKRSTSFPARLVDRIVFSFMHTACVENKLARVRAALGDAFPDRIFVTNARQSLGAYLAHEFGRVSIGDDDWAALVACGKEAVRRFGEAAIAATIASEEDVPENSKRAGREPTEESRATKTSRRMKRIFFTHLEDFIIAWLWKVHRSSASCARDIWEDGRSIGAFGTRINNDITARIRSMLKTAKTTDTAALMNNVVAQRPAPESLTIEQQQLLDRLVSTHWIPKMPRKGRGYPAKH